MDKEQLSLLVRIYGQIFLFLFCPFTVGSSPDIWQALSSSLLPCIAQGNVSFLLRHSEDSYYLVKALYNCPITLIPKALVCEQTAVDLNSPFDFSTSKESYLLCFRSAIKLSFYVINYIFYI